MKITDASGHEVPRITTISRYFRRESDTLQSFNAEIKALSDADKDELARGAAKELGYTVQD